MADGRVPDGVSAPAVHISVRHSATRAVLRWLWRWPDVVASLLLAAIALLVGVSVLARYVFSFGLPWMEELIRYLFIWLAFVGGASAANHMAHFRMVLFRDALLPRASRHLDSFAHLVFLSLGLLLLKTGVDLVSATLGQRSPVLGVPMGWVYASMPASGLMIVLYSASHSVDGFSAGTWWLKRFRSNSREDRQ